MRIINTAKRKSKIHWHIFSRICRGLSIWDHLIMTLHSGKWILLTVKFPMNHFFRWFWETGNPNPIILRSLIEGQMPQSKPIEPLNSQQMDAFRLSANGAKLPEKLMEELNATARKVKKKKTGRFHSNSFQNKSDICYLYRKLQYVAKVDYFF